MDTDRENNRILVFPRTVLSKELVAIFSEINKKRKVEFSGTCSYRFGVYNNFPITGHLDRIQGLATCPDPLGYVIFDTKMERSPGKEPLYSVRGMEFYTTGQFLQTSLTMARAFIAEDPLQDTNTTRQLEDLVYGNSDLINLICADMDSYFVANPNPKC